ncbi:hypothetical protein A2215_03860 [Candidatus Berkelbacteria bacterium RIFOXYA2_FULL_43_10]|uniref:Uncharacterized protein n=1 Tax=Candidatus Berkelbacteria bacterium RIFOXYA2_FULL_43_10 TaxID=1797472 RepID=A0A1F5E449_9BACT|nr:MAG: hypothetical protein A2215_03860 [Candidatus Berkelbacteria bacterium RIFOXYA2_FULL_43_10]
MFFIFFIFITDRRVKTPITALEPRFHFLANLALVLLALKLILGGEYRLDKLSFGTIIEVVVQTAYLGLPTSQLRL